MTGSAALRRWRVALIGTGVVVLAIAAAQLVAQVPPGRYLGIAAWLLGALILHDGVLAFTVLGASIVVRRLALPVPFAVIVIVQGAVVVAGIVTILVLPAVIKKAIGSANPSILPLDYLANLGLFYLATAALTAVVVGVVLAIRMLRERRTRTS